MLHEGRLLQCDTPEALKGRIQGAILSIASKDPRGIRTVISSLPGVVSTLLAGGSVRVAVDDALRRLPELTKALTASGLPFEPPERTPTTIEDLFVTLENPTEVAA